MGVITKQSFVLSLQLNGFVGQSVAQSSNRHLIRANLIQGTLRFLTHLGLELLELTILLLTVLLDLILSLLLGLFQTTSLAWKRIKTG